MAHLAQLVPKETKAILVRLELRGCLPRASVSRGIRALKASRETRDWRECQVSPGNQAKRAKGDGEERLENQDPKARLVRPEPRGRRGREERGASPVSKVRRGPLG